MGVKRMGLNIFDKILIGEGSDRDKEMALDEMSRKLDRVEDRIADLESERGRISDERNWDMITERLKSLDSRKCELEEEMDRIKRSW